MPSNMTHPVGTLLEKRYRILRVVGDGGYGVVYEAEDTRHNDCHVAVKSINLAGLTTQQIIEATAAFNREVVLLSKLKHFSLPSISDSFTDPEHWYMVMDFIEGETLEKYITYTVMPGIGKWRMPLKEILEIGMQLCTVLSYLHTQEPPVIFRDLKPANIMRADDGHLFLIDFGIARLYKVGQDKDTVPLGSPGYAAPEQYGKAQTTARADIYSLGATLHQLVSGNDPSESPFHFAPLIVPGQPFMPVLDALVQQMVEMDASKRPTSMTIVKRRLQQLMLEMYPLPPVPSAPPARKFAVSRRTVVGTVLTLLVVGGLMSGIPMSLREQDMNPMPPEMPPGQPPPINQAVYTYRGHQSEISAVAWSPKGHVIASGDASGNVLIWDAATGTTLKSSLLQAQASAELTATPNNSNFFVRSLSWSPDGQQLAIAFGNGTVYIWDMRAKFPALIYSNLSTFTDAAWSPNGKYIALADYDFKVLVWEVGTSYTPISLIAGGTGVFSITWSPDSRQVAAGCGDNILRVWNITGGQPQYELTSHRHIRIDIAAWSPDGSAIAAIGGSALVNDLPVIIWSAKSRSENPLLVYTYGRGVSIDAVAWSPNSALIASSGSDGAVRVWEASSGQTSMIYTGHVGYVGHISWSPDGQYIASGGDDGTVQVWSPYTTGT